MHNPPHTAEPSNGLCALIFIALLVLRGVTVVVGQVELGPWNFFAATAIATIKAVLILLFFMRVSYGTPLLKLMAGAGFFWLALLFGLTLNDYLTRHGSSARSPSEPASSNVEGTPGPSGL
jgi:cytochrome c oxidase subunit IV